MIPCATEWQFHTLLGSNSIRHGVAIPCRLRGFKVEWVGGVTYGLRGVRDGTEESYGENLNLKSFSQKALNM